MKTLILTALAALLASPAFAVIDIVSINHPTTVTIDLPGYGWSGPSISGDINSTVNAASAGDTIYVAAGSYPHTSHEIFAGNWTANNVVVIGPANAVAEITIGASGGYAATTPTARTGCKIVNMTFRGTVAGARALNISATTAGPFTLDNVTFNNTGLSIYHAAAGAASGITITNCRFRSMQNNPALAYIVAQAGSTNWTFSNNDLDMSTATISAGNISCFQLYGITNLVFTNNTVRFPAANQAQTLNGMWITGNAGVNSDSPTITHNTFISQLNAAGGWRTVYFGGITTASIGSVDDIMFAYNTIIMPMNPAGSYYGFEIGYVAASSQTYSENFQVIGNRVIGGVNGILIAESGVRGTVSRNWTTGCLTSGIAAKDARYTVFTYNLVEDSQRGYYSAFNGTLASNNYGNVVVGNTFRRCTAGIWLNGATYAANDSATVYGGNIFDNCTNPALQNVTGIDLATWQAYTPAGGVKPAGLGSIDLSIVDTSAELRAVKGLHGVGPRNVGGTGINR